MGGKMYMGGGAKNAARKSLGQGNKVIQQDKEGPQEGHILRRKGGEGR